jgi:hypothetical protein
MAVTAEELSPGMHFFHFRVNGVLNSARLAHGWMGGCTFLAKDIDGRDEHDEI